MFSVGVVCQESPSINVGSPLLLVFVFVNCLERLPNSCFGNKARNFHETRTYVKRQNSQLFQPLCKIKWVLLVLRPRRWYMIIMKWDLPEMEQYRKENMSTKEPKNSRIKYVYSCSMSDSSGPEKISISLLSVLGPITVQYSVGN